MTVENWDVDQAVVLLPSGDDAEGDAPVYARRYGVTAWEASHHEPLDVFLEQELPEVRDAPDDDDEWIDVEDNDRFPGRILADDAVADDDYGRAVEDAEAFTAEELAMHIVDV